MERCLIRYNINNKTGLNPRPDEYQFFIHHSELNSIIFSFHFLLHFIFFPIISLKIIHFTFFSRFLVAASQGFFNFALIFSFSLCFLMFYEHLLPSISSHFHLPLSTVFVLHSKSNDTIENIIFKFSSLKCR